VSRPSPELAAPQVVVVLDGRPDDLAGLTPDSLNTQITEAAQK
jgi:hypothetical protein